MIAKLCQLCGERPVVARDRQCMTCKALIHDIRAKAMHERYQANPEYYLRRKRVVNHTNCDTNRAECVTVEPLPTS